MGVEADCIKTVKETIKAFGGLDIIISNAVCHLPHIPYSSIY
jgi:NAD(P)-dependent dehydrogenase (short-subunit alcohol dehydrogenase family)